MKKGLIFKIIILSFIIAPVVAGAVTIGKFTPIVQGIFPNSGEFSFEAYVNLIIKFMIAFAGLMAVVVIVIAGLMYITAGPKEGQTEKAKEIIWNAVIGLLIAVGFYLILYAINPSLVKVNLGLDDSFDYTLPNDALDAGAFPVGAVFNNTASPELSALISCLKLYIPTLFVTSTTDDNILSGKCNPTDPSESFGDPNNCQHAKNSCHYGGTNCIEKGSFAADIRSQGVSYTANNVKATAQECAPGSYFLDEGDHYHVSVGAINDCGCN